MIVADTSLLANFYLEERRDQALAVFQRDAEWFTSPLWRFELHNTLLKYMRAGLLPISEAESIMVKVAALIADRERLASSAQVLQAALTYGVSAYDADYIALAQQLRVPLVTFDQKLVRAASRIALSPAEFLG
jgi:predicted nucleic acid-binding protein